MMRCGLGLTLASMVLLGPGAPADGQAADAVRKPIPVILDTDIGDDIDDTFALLMLARSKELDLKLVVTDFGDTHYRARLTAKLLTTFGRTDVPVGVGIRQDEKGVAQAEWLGDYALASYAGRVYPDGVQALIDTIMASKEEITLIAIGPAPNLEEALRREPRIAERARLVGMYGSLYRGYGDRTKPEAEWNVKSAVSAFRRMVEAPWPGLFTPLDTCGVVRLQGERWARVLASQEPGAKALVENYRVWCRARPELCGKDPTRVDRETTTQFDTVAVYLAFAQDLVRIEEVGVAVDDSGMTIPSKAGRKHRWAVEWKDQGAFEELLAERLIAPR